MNEDELRRAFKQGVTIDLSGEPAEARVIPAEAIRSLLVPTNQADVDDASRLDMLGAQISGELNLSYVSVRFPVIFRSCGFTEPVKVREARLPTFTFYDCMFPELDATHIQVDGEFDLSEAHGCTRIILTGAHVKDDLHLARAVIEGAQELAVDARYIRVDGNVDCERLCVNGAFSLEGSHIGGSLILEHAHLENDGPSDEDKALAADGVSVGYELKASNITSIGQLSFEDFRCPGSVEFRDANILRSNPHNRALCLDRARIAGSIFCDNDFHTEGTFKAMAITVEGSLYLDGASLDKPCEHALIIDRSKISGVVTARKNSKPFSAHGTISMKGTTITGGLDFCAAQIHVDNGESLVADRAKIGGRVCLYDGFEATGCVSLANAEIPGRVILDTRKLHSQDPEGPAVDLNQARIGVLRLIEAPQEGAVDFTGASLGLLFDDPEYYINPKRSIILNGLSYREIHASSVDLRDRIEWLRTGTAKIRKSNDRYGKPSIGKVPPQPWIELAAAYRRLGSSRDARIILLEREREKNRRQPWRSQWWLWKLWNYIQDWTIGYGYVPWRAFVWIILMLGFSVGYFGAVQPPAASKTGAGGPFTLLDAITYTVDLLLPIGLGGKTAWHPTGFGMILALILSIAGWVFSITAIVGITRTMRD